MDCTTRCVAARRENSYAWCRVKSSTSRWTSARSSATFGRGVGVALSAANNRQLWVPPGFAHGFLVTGESAEFLYKTTDYWHPQFERTLAVERSGARHPLAHRRRLAAARRPRMRQASCWPRPTHTRDERQLNAQIIVLAAQL